MKIRDYVRTEYGIIGKITKIIDGELDEAYLNFKNMCVYSKNCLGNKGKIIKSSPNIIDLIEVGDYVNGCLIVEISKDPFIKGQINLWTNMIISEGEPFPNEYYKAKILKKDIKSIVTKEQFESMEYKVGDDKE